MNKYTRHEFFKSIIPASVGVVLFLGSTTKSDKELIPYEVFLISDRELTEDEIKRGKELEYLALEYLSSTSDLYFLKG